ncbi:winged helix-turn-helix transcriptional regulator [Nocardia sp. NPDC002869]|uniref:winged helix-turn-helix transcriptional regulator n=1 Tax=Nocardia sp. NPDC002869 TaxID=3161032 RepID=UPI00398C8F19
MRDGLVARTVEPVMPPRVSYELTGLGRGLTVPMQQFLDWIRLHIRCHGRPAPPRPEELTARRFTGSRDPDPRGGVLRIRAWRLWCEALLHGYGVSTNHALAQWIKPKPAGSRR